ncbi:MAG: hypothetical protein MUD09_09865 [Desulfobacterales bacterium]|nr:hypothetical protein [Desulfobacterales bacterium]
MGQRPRFLFSVHRQGGKGGRFSQDEITTIFRVHADKGKVNILSSPSILASDSKEAKINVTKEIPVATSTYTFDNSNDNLLETSIQYRDTGVILSVTPHINEFGLVSMDVNQEVSQEGGLVRISENEERPSFFKRTINTTLTVYFRGKITIHGKG